jgi:hypothetical protein
MYAKDTPHGKNSIARRLRSIRIEVYGERGGPVLARQLRLPFPTWANYESGVTIPGDVLLRFLETTGTNPRWLLHGTGPKYMAKVFPGSADASMN